MSFEKDYSNNTRISKLSKNAHISIDNVNNYDYKEKRNKTQKNKLIYNINNNIDNVNNDINDIIKKINYYQNNIDIIKQNIKYNSYNHADISNLEIFTQKINELQLKLNSLQLQLSKLNDEKKKLEQYPLKIEKLQMEISFKKKQLQQIRNKEKNYTLLKKKIDINIVVEKEKLIENISNLNKQITDLMNQFKMFKLYIQYDKILYDLINSFITKYKLKKKYNDDECYYLYCNNYSNMNDSDIYVYVKNNSKFLLLKQQFDDTSLNRLKFNQVKKNNHFDDDDDDAW